ncbi:MAG: GNAT family N-acetyltransferase [Flammeovirgaceae bacterium]|nr:MAG: GNAT family N-acetyltransferase [Flammeovirgaceae bacterium]
MEIRPAQEGDIPAIVELLKLSLGESRMPKSEAFWRWKHLENPFGKSPVLLAIEGDKLIGVRAFIRWEWKQGDKIYKTVRAVDTATHPEHQGKGIFKKLTLDLVHQCREEGIDFIFNTPNTNSKPGYLKMGWSALGRLNINFRPVFRLLTRTASDFEEQFRWNEEAVNRLQYLSSSNVMVTHHKPGFFHWRYGSNPNVRYYMAGNEKVGLYIIFRIKPIRLGTEFRVVNMITPNAITKKQFDAVLMPAVKQVGPCLITYAGEQILPGFISMKVGPVVTIHSLNIDKPLSFGVWKPSLGDMEVF